MIRMKHKRERGAVVVHENGVQGRIDQPMGCMGVCKQETRNTTQT